MNLGRYPELTFTSWFKPMAGTGTSGRIFDFGNGQQMDNIILSRSWDSGNDQICMSVVRDGTLYTQRAVHGSWVCLCLYVFCMAVRLAFYQSISLSVCLHVCLYIHVSSDCESGPCIRRGLYMAHGYVYACMFFVSAFLYAPVSV